jgi:hypothetical protein
MYQAKRMARSAAEADPAKATPVRSASPASPVVALPKIDVIVGPPLDFEVGQPGRIAFERQPKAMYTDACIEVNSRTYVTDLRVGRTDMAAFQEADAGAGKLQLVE